MCTRAIIFAVVWLSIAADPVLGAETLDPKLLALEANRWTKVDQSGHTKWRRDGHMGMAYDSKRGVLLFFGSGTHGKNWDNAVYQFDPVSGRWETHYAPAPEESYRADPIGNRVTGIGRPQPWAMHVFDGMVYDPVRDALVVAARPGHNPMRKTLRSAKIDPVWVYELGFRQWRMMVNGGEPPPVVFAGGTAYDRIRDTIVLSRPHKRGGEVWELGPGRRKWVRAWRGKRQHSIHVNMGYDSKNRRIVVFGDYKPTEKVAVYAPGAQAGEPGRWHKSVPGGDRCPEVTKTPIAYSERDGVFLVVPRIGKSRKTATCVYDAATHRYRRVPGVGLERGHMNFMMAYDIRHDVFLMVTGNWRAPPEVWAFKLDLDALEPSSTKQF